VDKKQVIEDQRELIMLAKSIPNLAATFLMKLFKKVHKKRILGVYAELRIQVGVPSSRWVEILDRCQITGVSCFLTDYDLSGSISQLSFELNFKSC
jgi:hypothetical protein